MKMRRTNNYIYQDPDNNEIRIATTCLKVLTGPRNAKSKKLHPYAGEFLLSHLQKTDLSFADRDLKGEVGRLLFKLFHEEFAIDSFFWAVNHEEMDYDAWSQNVLPRGEKVRSSWLYGDEGPTELVRWFKDTAVMRGIRDYCGTQWATELTQSGAKVQELLLCHAAKRMALHLLREAFWAEEVYTAFDFLRGYLEQVQILHHESVKEQRLILLD
jgi:hypothetical protein